MCNGWEVAIRERHLGLMPYTVYTYILTMNESPLIISNTCIIPHNLIALTIAFIKKKTELSYIDLKKKKINIRKCVEYTYIQTNMIETTVRIVLCNLGQLKAWILFP